MARKDFHHPFQPYDIQQQFMEAVYECIENGEVGIFESPTGTGKSLSLICGSLTWLREHKRKTFDMSLQDTAMDDDEPEWMIEHARQSRRKEALALRADFEKRLSKVRAQEAKVRERQANGEPPRKRRRPADSKSADSEAVEDQFMLDDYESDSEQRSVGNGETQYSAQTVKLLEKLGMLHSKIEDRAVEVPEETKVYFCSRTHSQLSQFVGELQRVQLPPGIPPDSDQSDDVPPEELKHLTLGSRKNLCINPKVTKLSSQTAVNERCLELQQPSTPADHKCPFVPKKDNEDSVLDFRDHALAKIRDIEDLAGVGKKLGICPYYASRSAIAPAEIVTLPYPLLLQKSAREALGISLKGHVVIIDEAHNLMDAVEGIYSAEISETQLRLARESLIMYLQRFRNKLKGSNRVYVTQVARVIDSLLGFIARMRDSNITGGIAESSSLLSGKAVDQINLTKLVRYLNESKLARKVEGYIAHSKQAAATDCPDASTKSPDVPTLTHVQNFLVTLMNPAREGRFFWELTDGVVKLRYMLLDPSEHFRDIVDEARSVVLAGGTMSPMDDYVQQLFPYLSSVKTLSCGHVIPSSNLLVRVVSAGGSDPFQFTYKTRNDPSLIKRLGSAILEVTRHVNGGTVVFFSSYSYLELVRFQWQRDGFASKMAAAKSVFFDSRIEPAESTFQAYSEAVKTGGKGALLFSVIGGKLSEGINFSDDLGRCVIVVGLPYPNAQTAEWKAKTEYINSKMKGRADPGMEHLENVTMRAVNQAIGRVIRHKNDWASVLLFDARYANEKVQSKLPGWMQGSLKTGRKSTQLVDVVRDIEGFFAMPR